MAENTLIKAERVVRTALGLLERDVVLPRLVWRDAAGDFRGAKGDTITVRLPAYTKADKRGLRAGTPKSKREIHERSIAVTLDDNLYRVIPITDEELTLDIESFERQLVLPAVSSIVRGLEDEVVTLMEGATYEHSIELDLADPYNTAVDARELLNKSSVPMSGRVLALGSEFDSRFLKSPQFVNADKSGSTGALRDAELGRIAGFRVVTVPGLAPDEAYAFHQTAYVLSSRAPFVPDGVAWGRSEQFEGFSIRVAKQVDPDELVDNFHTDVFVGTNIVTDVGSIDATTGKFEPAEDPEDSGASELFVRSVKIAIGSV